MTDSGSLKEEFTILVTPCLTLRWNAERPITLKENAGVRVLMANNIERIKAEYRKILNKPRTPYRLELWDGKAAEILEWHAWNRYKKHRTCQIMS